MRREVLCRTLGWRGPCAIGASRRVAFVDIGRIVWSWKTDGEMELMSEVMFVREVDVSEEQRLFTCCCPA